jgi:hypothetical protein
MANRDEIIRRLAAEGIDDALSRLFTLEPKAELNLYVRTANGRLYCEGVWREPGMTVGSVHCAAGESAVKVIAELAVDAALKLKGEDDCD